MDNSLSKKEKRKLAKEDKRNKAKKDQLVKRLKRWGTGLLILLGIFYVGYKTVIWFRTPVEVPQDLANIEEDDWFKGNQNARAVLIEYADFQCPACAFSQQYVKQLLEEYPNDVIFVFRHFPLISVHRNAFDAARAAEAAGKQGKFWEMHDLLFERQGEWENESSVKQNFVDYAQELGLNLGQFLTDFGGDEVKEQIDNDLLSANSMKLNSTPTFFLNGALIKSPVNYEEFKEIIEAELTVITKND